MDSGLRLNDIDNIRIRRFIKVRSDKRVYDVNAKEYWKEREYTNAKNSINGSLTLTKLFQAQQGRCEYCKQPITDIQVRDTAIHKHHLKPRSERRGLEVRQPKTSPRKMPHFTSRRVLTKRNGWLQRQWY